MNDKDSEIQKKLKEDVKAKKIDFLERIETSVSDIVQMILSENMEGSIKEGVKDSLTTVEHNIQQIKDSMEKVNSKIYTSSGELDKHNQTLVFVSEIQQVIQNDIKKLIDDVNEIHNKFENDDEDTVEKKIAILDQKLLSIITTLSLVKQSLEKVDKDKSTLTILNQITNNQGNIIQDIEKILKEANEVKVIKNEISSMNGYLSSISTTENDIVSVLYGDKEDNIRKAVNTLESNVCEVQNNIIELNEYIKNYKQTIDEKNEVYQNTVFDLMDKVTQHSAKIIEQNKMIKSLIGLGVVNLIAIICVIILSIS